MHIQQTALPDVKIITLDVFGDSRGFFVERFNAQRFAEHGLPTNFVQDNHSRSTPGVLRGFHFQPNPAQGTLVGAARGAIFDVAVDIRPESPNFGKWVGETLSDENGKLLWEVEHGGSGAIGVGSLTPIPTGDTERHRVPE